MGIALRKSLEIGVLIAALFVVPLSAAQAATPAPQSTATPAAQVELTLVAIGDSITERGEGAETGWLNDYAGHLRTAASVDTNIVNFGIDGATSGEILQGVQHDAGIREAISKADIVTYEAGINDFLQARQRYIDGTCGGADGEDCLRAMTASFRSNWDGLVAGVNELAPHAAKRGMTTYYPAIAFDHEHGYESVLSRYIAAMNAHIRGHAGAPLADVGRVFNGPDGSEDPAAKNYLLGDGLHPSFLGHLAIYYQLNLLGYDDMPGVHVTSLRPQVNPAPSEKPRSSGHFWTLAGGIVAAVGVAVLALVLASWLLSHVRRSSSST